MRVFVCLLSVEWAFGLQVSQGAEVLRSLRMSVASCVRIFGIGPPVLARVGSGRTCFSEVLSWIPSTSNDFLLKASLGLLWGTLSQTVILLPTFYRYQGPLGDLP